MGWLAKLLPLRKLWKTAISVFLLPENPCGAITPSAVRGFQSLS
jgi:hypothetical protein